jgi:hypothetical protein
VFIVNSDSPKAIAQVEQGLLPGGSLGLVFPSPTITTNDGNIPFILNPNILLPSRASTPYPLYLSLLLPTYQENEDMHGSYYPHSPTLELTNEVLPVEESGISPGEE